MTELATAPKYTAESYQLAIPGMDGYRSEKLVVTLAGALDKTSSDDLDVLGALKLGQTVELKVTAIVNRKNFGLALGEEESLGYTVGLKAQYFEMIS